MNRINSAAWAALEAHRSEIASTQLRELFAKDPARADSLALAFEGIHFDFSKQRVIPKTIGLLADLAREAGLAEWTGRMFGGERINASEERSVLHVALRQATGPFPSNDFDVMPEVLETRRRMAEFAERLRSGQCLGHKGAPIRNVVNIGIGGSDLGPKMLCHALRSIAHPTLGVHFVSNLDSAQLAPLLQTLDPRTTLFIVVSKTFTTQETMFNALSARAWLAANLGDELDTANHFVAVTAKPERAVSFGIGAGSVFPIWDWVGGRYSLWSAVGLALMIAIGPHAFGELLAGAQRMDEHFRSAPFEKNLPVVMAMLGIWNTNFLGAATNAVLPYNESLQYLPSYLQQLEMESNGKSVGRDGLPLSVQACPVVWGELGNNGQHAFFQLLHQGGRLVPCDFIAAARSDFPLGDHQAALLANCFAQSAALAFGKTADEARQQMIEEGLAAAKIDELLPHKVFAGNQPSSTLMLARLDAQTLGALIALYEHKVFVQGVVWGINSFDQWGVELGKAVANRILPAIKDASLAKNFDASTQRLIAFVREHMV
ncbi:glucose-6-phosphate isomerase [Propionivibrio soli]|uniref:glucose-6-phosphate isomerase n=1 Tax=Propionivibrio soli TaxID=2976531 RepID=UPI0021E8FD97|nr:glucose-6-phosphate isomerase [Propionivibrio soli]